MICCLLLPWAAIRVTRSWRRCRFKARLGFRRYKRRKSLQQRENRQPRSRRWKNGICISLLCQRLLLFAHASCTPMETIRYGEALHPGPTCYLGTTNPGGIRGKEMIYGQLPNGIWGTAETHLAAPGLRAVTCAFHRVGREYNRKFSVRPGAMVPLRNRSDTAGTCSGVMTVGDAILRPININWPGNEFAAIGRMLAWFILSHWCHYLWLAFWPYISQCGFGHQCAPGDCDQRVGHL